jgi:hypothetical protein
VAAAAPFMIAEDQRGTELFAIAEPTEAAGGTAEPVKVLDRAVLNS